MQFSIKPTARKKSVDTAYPAFLPKLSNKSGEGADENHQLDTRNPGPAMSQTAHHFGALSLLQPKTGLTISEPQDSEELEADQVTEEILRPSAAEMDPEAQVLRGGAHKKLTRKTAWRAGSGSMAASRESWAGIDALVDSTVRRDGEPLSAKTRRFMEPRFGHDFSQVRVHTDEEASRSAEAVQAHAYTLGNDIVFREGKYNPGSRDGDRLLAHELTHVVQQDTNRSVVYRDDAPPNQAGVQSQAPQAVTLDDVDQQKLDAEIALVVGIARANFSGAVQNAISQVIVQKEVDESTKKGFEQNLALAVGSIFLPEVLGAMSVAVQGMLKDAILPMVKGPVAGDKTLVNQLIEEKFTSSAISGYLASAQSLLGSKEFLVMGNNKYARTWTYLNGLDAINAANLTAGGLAAIRGGKSESIIFFSLMKYLAAHAEIYREDILTRANHYIDEVADVVLGDDLSGSIVGPQLCKINAYGRDRWARVQAGRLNGWVFLQWVDPDAAEALESQSAGKPIPRLSPEEIAGHLPDPVLESGGQKTPGGQPTRTEWTNAWGGLRLVEVAVPEGMQGTGEYIFRRWIPAAEQDAAIARAENQIGEIDASRPISADKIRGKETPTEPPLR